MQEYKDFLGLGIAGNFALHLDQAGEAEDFKNIITADEAAPKGLFPFYLPRKAKNVNNPFLNTNPLSATTLILPTKKCNVQAEPEVGILFKLTYVDTRVVAIEPTHFGAFSDYSIRVAGAKKINDKKNWGENSKGFSKTLIEIDSFSEGGIMDEYSICSFLRRNDKLQAYGEDVELKGYSYFHSKLTNWIVSQINVQEDFGPLENISAYIRHNSYPRNAVICIGATRYTEYGEKTFLQSGDELIIVLYPHKEYSYKEVYAHIEKGQYSQKNMSILAQRVE